MTKWYTDTSGFSLPQIEKKARAAGSAVLRYRRGIGVQTPKGWYLFTVYDSRVHYTQMCGKRQRRLRTQTHHRAMMARWGERTGHLWRSM